MPHGQCAETRPPVADFGISVAMADKLEGFKLARIFGKGLESYYKNNVWKFKMAKWNKRLYTWEPITLTKRHY